MQSFTGFEYLKIDAANNYGLDKKLFDERLDWIDEHYDNLEDLIPQADDPVLFAKSVLALRHAERGEAIGHLVEFDATASGPQIMACLSGCARSARLTNLIDPVVRFDMYTEITMAMNRRLPPNKQIKLSSGEGLSRADVKDAIMTWCYGSKSNPEKHFEDEVVLDAFYQTMKEEMPGVYAIRNRLLNTWQSWQHTHEWVLPDFFHVVARNFVENDIEVKVDEIGGIQFTHRFYEHKGERKGLSLAANVIHSIDGFIVREMARRCMFDREHLKHVLARLNEHLELVPEPTTWDRSDVCTLELANRLELVFDKASPSLKYRLKGLIERTLARKTFRLVTIHDAFKSHCNHMEQVRQTYRELLSEIHESTLLSDILSRISGRYQRFDKERTDLSRYILNSNYALC